ncbi:hypothetical protein D3C73_1441330 [compost metagenome]
MVEHRQQMVNIHFMGQSEQEQRHEKDIEQHHERVHSGHGFNALPDHINCNEQNQDDQDGDRCVQQHIVFNEIDELPQDGGGCIQIELQH